MKRAGRKVSAEVQARRAFKLVKGNGGEWFVIFRRDAYLDCPAGRASLPTGTQYKPAADLSYQFLIDAVAHEIEEAIRRALHAPKAGKKKGQAR